MALSIRDKAILAWNSGMTVEDAEKRFKTDLSHFFKDFEKRYGCKSIPISDMHEGGRFRTKTLTPEYMNWKGLTGSGARLREIIKQANSCSEL